MLGIYCRISKDKEDGKDRSINDQKLLGIELAKKLGVDYEVYIDEGLSGTLSIEDRPSLFKLVQDGENGKIKMFYYYDQSRLEREPETYLTLTKLFTKKKIRCFTNVGEVVFNPESILLGTVMSAFNKFYVEVTKQKVKSVLKRNAQTGKVHAIAPYGYTKDADGAMVVDEVQSKVIKRIFEMSLNGIGTRKIAEILTAEKIPTKYNLIGKGTLTTINRKSNLKSEVTKNKKDVIWSGNTIRSILVNPVYYGKRVFSGVEYSVPAIFDYDYWKLVNDNLQANRNNTGKKVDHIYKLKGFITCAKCGRNYYGRSRVNKKDHYYMCSSKRLKTENCGNRSINIDFIENLVDYFLTEQKYQHIEDNASYFIQTTDNYLVKLTEIKKQIDGVEVEIQNLVVAVSKGIFKLNQAEFRMKELNQTKDQLQQEYDLIKKTNTYSMNTLSDIIYNITIEYNTNYNIYCISFYIKKNPKICMQYIFTTNYKFIECYVTNNEKLNDGDVNLNLIEVEDKYLENHSLR